MRRCILAVTTAAALLLLAGCSPGDSVADPPATDVTVDPAAQEDGDGAVDQPAAAEESVEGDDGESEPEPTIRDFDFGNAIWQDDRNVSEVPLVDGAFTGEYGQEWTYTEEAVFADVDGDGHDDALAALQQQDGQGLVVQWFLWRWDPDAEDGAGDAVQVLDPVAVTARCGNEVHDVAAGEGVFVVTESVRLHSDDISCAEDPPREHTRSIALEDGYPVQVDPVRGYGGVCGTRVNNEADPAPPSWQVYVAPDQLTPLVTEMDQVSRAVVLYSGDTPMRPDGWVMVRLDLGHDDDVAHWPCGFIVGEQTG